MAKKCVDVSEEISRKMKAASLRPKFTHCCCEDTHKAVDDKGSHLCIVKGGGYYKLLKENDIGGVKKDGKAFACIFCHQANVTSDVVAIQRTLKTIKESLKYENISTSDASYSWYKLTPTEYKCMEKIFHAETKKIRRKTE